MTRRTKTLIGIQSGSELHWVGDGFPVKTLFTYQEQSARLSPFLLLDYARPTEFAPSASPRGVGKHPHRGFETVTIVYQGGLEHRDSAGNHGRIGPGDVQWMTAASGVVHEEWHEPAFTQRGGILEMAQLWVNLPAKYKMAPPRYQEILDRQIPNIPLEAGGSLRVIAGLFRDTLGPAKTFTPMSVLDLRLEERGRVELSLPEGHTTLAVVLQGKALMNGTREAAAGESATFDLVGDGVVIEALEKAKLLILTGAPIDEPVVGYGPFVMNTEEEIRQAISDFQTGNLGREQR